MNLTHPRVLVVHDGMEAIGYLLLKANRIDQLWNVSEFIKATERSTSIECFILFDSLDLQGMGLKSSLEMILYLRYEALQGWERVPILILHFDSKDRLLMRYPGINLTAFGCKVLDLPFRTTDWEKSIKALKPVEKLPPVKEVSVFLKDRVSEQIRLYFHTYIPNPIGANRRNLQEFLENQTDENYSHLRRSFNDPSTWWQAKNQVGTLRRRVGCCGFTEENYPELERLAESFKGMEEFTVLISETAKDEVFNACNKIRKSIDEIFKMRESLQGRNYLPIK